MFHHFPIYINTVEFLCIAVLGLVALYLAFKFGAYWRETELDQEAVKEAALDRYFENLLSAKIDLSIGKN